MPDFSLVPVEHQPDFSDVSLIPVDHDPFSADGAIQQPGMQPESQLQRATTYNDPEGDAAAMSPETYVNPFVKRTLGDLATLPQRAIDAAKISAAHNYGPSPDVMSDSDAPFVDPLPSVAAETALTMMGGSRPVPVATGMIPAAKGVAGSVAEEAGAGLRALTDAAPRSPASRAAEKGYSGIGATRNGGPNFAGTYHLYPAGEGQQSVVQIRLTGSRRDDFKLANELGGFSETPDEYMWHHVDDFDPQTGTSSLQLVDKDAHRATHPHAGSVAQYEKFHGIPYKR
jgi:hypothetical protein